MSNNKSYPELPADGPNDVVGEPMASAVSNVTSPVQSSERWDPGIGPYTSEEVEERVRIMEMQPDNGVPHSVFMQQLKNEIHV